MSNIVQIFTGQAGPVNKKLTGPRQYLLATGQQASAKLYTAIVYLNSLLSWVSEDPNWHYCLFEFFVELGLWRS